MRDDRGSAPPEGGAAGSMPALDVEEFRRLGYRAVDIAAEHLAGMRARPVFVPMSDAERASLLDQPLPTAGIDPDLLLDVVQQQIFAHPMGNGHPRFFGWVNSPPAPLAILAELLAATLDPSCAGGDHAAIYLERCAVRWLMELVGYPTDGSMGLLVSGGSMASLTCLTAARRRALTRLGHDVRAAGLAGPTTPRLVLYISGEGHSCVRKAVELLGLGGEAIRVIPVDDRFQIDLGALRAAIATDRAAGCVPFCVSGNAGTVNTGAIDPLDALADLCAAEGLWLHVDGAYGAVGILDPAVAPRYRGLERADSLALDPHKWLSIPVECGCALVRDGEMLRDAFSLVPPYLRVEANRGFGALPWLAEYGFQQTRGFRALKLWMTLAHAGRNGLSATIARHNRLARGLAALIEATPDLELLAPVELSIVCFRYHPQDLNDETELGRLNASIVEEVQRGGRTFITGTTLGTRGALHACILHYDTDETDLATLVEIVHTTGATLTATHHRLRSPSAD